MTNQRRNHSTKSKKNHRKVSVNMGNPLLPVIALGLSLVSMLFFFFLGVFHAMTWSLALILGGVFGLVFLGVYYLVSNRKRTPENPIEAEVVQKKILHKIERTSKDDTVLLVVFRTTDGKERKMNFAKNKDLYHYYQTGDVVRFYPDLPYPEKLDKRFDYDVVCVSCGELNPMIHEQCKFCRHTLMK